MSFFSWKVNTSSFLKVLLCPVSHCKQNADTYLKMLYLSLFLSQYINQIQHPMESPSCLYLCMFHLFLTLIWLIFKSQSSLFAFAACILILLSPSFCESSGPYSELDSFAYCSSTNFHAPAADRKNHQIGPLMSKIS